MSAVVCSHVRKRSIGVYEDHVEHLLRGVERVVVHRGACNAQRQASTTLSAASRAFSIARSPRDRPRARRFVARRLESIAAARSAMCRPDRRGTRRRVPHCLLSDEHCGTAGSREVLARARRRARRPRRTATATPALPRILNASAIPVDTGSIEEGETALQAQFRDGKDGRRARESAPSRPRTARRRATARRPGQCTPIRGARVPTRSVHRRPTPTRRLVPRPL